MLQNSSCSSCFLSYWRSWGQVQGAFEWASSGTLRWISPHVSSMKRRIESKLLMHSLHCAFWRIVELAIGSLSCRAGHWQLAALESKHDSRQPRLHFPLTAGGCYIRKEKQDNNTTRQHYNRTTRQQSKNTRNREDSNTRRQDSPTYIVLASKWICSISTEPCEHVQQS